MYKNFLFNSLLLCSLSITLIACQTHQYLEYNQLSQVNPNIQRKAIPQTPNQISLPEFGKNLIAWGSGVEGAKHRYKTVTRQDVNVMKQKGLTREIALEWQYFYENENQRNAGNITAVYRAKLMKKIIKLW